METPIEKTEEKVSLQSTVEKTIENMNPDGTLKTEEKKVDEKKVDVKVDDKKDEKVVEKALDKLSDEDREIAAGLLLSLRDPDQAPAVIKWFAEKGGYTKAEAKEIISDLKEGTKKEQVEAKDEIMEAFAEQFGEEFAKKISPIFQKAISDRVSKLVGEETKSIKDTFESREISEASAKAESALTDIGNKFYEKDGIPAEVRGEMNKLMDQYKPSKGQTVEDYLSDIHALAAAKKGGSLKPVDKTKQEKIDRNKNDISGKLNNGRSPSPSETKDGKVADSSKLTAKQAVALAEEQLRETFK